MLEECSELDADTLLLLSGLASLKEVTLKPVHANCGQEGSNYLPKPTEQLFLTAAAIVSPSAAVAADGKANVWISGKSDPIRKTSKDKPDGTKKDNKYLGCLNDCVPRKQGPPGPSQLERADCLDACQQECCSTYEQCTYTIRKF